MARFRNTNRLAGVYIDDHRDETSFKDYYGLDADRLTVLSEPCLLLTRFLVAPDRAACVLKKMLDFVSCKDDIDGRSQAVLGATDKLHNILAAEDYFGFHQRRLAVGDNCRHLLAVSVLLDRIPDENSKILPDGGSPMPSTVR